MKRLFTLFLCAMSAWAKITPTKPATLVTAENAESLGLEASYEGYYAIANADQLYWFAGLVNGDATVCDGEAVKQNTSANAILTTDIVVNDTTDWKIWDDQTTGLRTWIPIGNMSKNYSGVFNGMRRTPE